jgi:hypothetical protein
MRLSAIAVTFASTRARDHEVATAYRLVHEPTPCVDGTSTYDKRASQVPGRGGRNSARSSVKTSAAQAAWSCATSRSWSGESQAAAAGLPAAATTIETSTRALAGGGDRLAHDAVRRDGPAGHGGGHGADVAQRGVTFERALGRR